MGILRYLNMLILACPERTSGQPQQNRQKLHFAINLNPPVIPEGSG